MLIGLTKIRNEGLIIKNTLDWWGKFCDKIYVCDECSTDKTAKICQSHPKVEEVIIRDYWDKDREKAEWVNRQIVLMKAKDKAAIDDWFVYFDADEFIYDFTLNDLKGDAVICKLFDIYITPRDKNKNWREREWIGPEYRQILFFFKNSPYLSYNMPDQREVNLAPNAKITYAGTIKHFGKGLSVKHWEETCGYYTDYWPKYADKWQARKGHAVHNYLSDFDNKLIKWKERNNKGFPLEFQINI